MLPILQYFFTVFLSFSKRMGEKKAKQKTIRNNKKASKIINSITLKLNNGAEVPAKTTYKKDDDFFEINDINMDKIRVSDKKLYMKKHDSNKYYVFYEYDDEYIPLRIV